jgi:hypothetical protein
LNLLTVVAVIWYMQVLHLLLTPELGSSLVLTASRPLEDSSAEQQQQQQQQQRSALPAARSISSSPVQQQQSPAAALSPERLSYTAQHAWKSGPQQQQQQSPAATAEPAVAGASVLPADVLNISERDLSALAEAIAAADAPRESDLEALLDSLVAEATAALEDQVIGEAAAAAADKGAVTAVPAADAEVMQRNVVGAEFAVASSPEAMEGTWSELQQQQQQQQQDAALHSAGVRRHLFGGADADVAAYASTTAAGAAAAAAAGSSPNSGGTADLQGEGVAAGAEAASWFRKPSTLPTLRSWMDRAAVLSAGTAAEGPTGAISNGCFES